MAFSLYLSLSVSLAMALLKYAKYQQVVDFADRSLPGYLVHLWTGSCGRACVGYERLWVSKYEYICA